MSERSGKAKKHKHATIVDAPASLSALAEPQPSTSDAKGYDEDEPADSLVNQDSNTSRNLVASPSSRSSIQQQSSVWDDFDATTTSAAPASPLAHTTENLAVAPADTPRDADPAAANEVVKTVEQIFLPHTGEVDSPEPYVLPDQCIEEMQRVTQLPPPKSFEIPSFSHLLAAIAAAKKPKAAPSAVPAASVGEPLVRSSNEQWWSNAPEVAGGHASPVPDSVTPTEVWLCRRTPQTAARVTPSSTPTARKQQDSDDATSRRQQPQLNDDDWEWQQDHDATLNRPNGDATRDGPTPSEQEQSVVGIRPVNGREQQRTAEIRPVQATYPKISSPVDVVEVVQVLEQEQESEMPQSHTHTAAPTPEPPPNTSTRRPRGNSMRKTSFNLPTADRRSSLSGQGGGAAAEVEISVSRKSSASSLSQVHPAPPCTDQYDLNRLPQMSVQETEKLKQEYARQLSRKGSTVSEHTVGGRRIGDGGSSDDAFVTSASIEAAGLPPALAELFGATVAKKPETPKVGAETQSASSPKPLEPPRSSATPQNRDDGNSGSASPQARNDAVALADDPSLSPQPQMLLRMKYLQDSERAKVRDVDLEREFAAFCSARRESQSRERSTVEARQEAAAKAAPSVPAGSPDGADGEPLHPMVEAKLAQLASVYQPPDPVPLEELASMHVGRLVKRSSRYSADPMPVAFLLQEMTDDELHYYERLKRRLAQIEEVLAEHSNRYKELRDGLDSGAVESYAFRALESHLESTKRENEKTIDAAWEYFLMMLDDGKASIPVIETIFDF